jgi:hypothetical protein
MGYLGHKRANNRNRCLDCTDVCLKRFHEAEEIKVDLRGVSYDVSFVDGIL